MNIIGMTIVILGILVAPIFLILGLLSLYKKNGKAKKNFTLFAVTFFVLPIVGALFMDEEFVNSSSNDDTDFIENKSLDAKQIVFDAYDNLKNATSFEQQNEADIISKMSSSSSVETVEIGENTIMQYIAENETYKIVSDITQNNNKVHIEEYKNGDDIIQSIDNGDFQSVGLENGNLLGYKIGILDNPVKEKSEGITDMIESGFVDVNVYEPKEGNKNIYLVQGTLPIEFAEKFVNEVFFGDSNSHLKVDASQLVLKKGILQFTVEKAEKRLLSNVVEMEIEFKIEDIDFSIVVNNVNRYSDYENIKEIILPN